MPATGAFPDRDGAIRAIEHHFRNRPIKNPIEDRWRSSPDLVFQSYSTDGDDWNSSMVLVHPDESRRMMTLAVYKLLNVSFAGDQASPATA